MPNARPIKPMRTAAPAPDPAASPASDLDLLTPDEVVTLLRNAVTIGTLCNWRCERQGPAWLRIGRTVFYRRADVHAWLIEQQKVTEREWRAG